MYCTACGKQIIDSARFCNYCGTPVRGVPFTAPTSSVPLSQPITVSENTEARSSAETTQPETTGTPSYTEPAQPESTEAPSYVEPAQPESAEAPSYTEPAQSESVEAPSYTEPAQPESAEAPSYTEPAQSESVEAPSYTETTSPTFVDNTTGTFSLPAPGQILSSGESTTSLPPILESPAKPLPERKYTFGHIMLCLGAVAIMAIVAGVFAGLYFSVV